MKKKNNNTTIPQFYFEQLIEIKELMGGDTNTQANETNIDLTNGEPINEINQMLQEKIEKEERETLDELYKGSKVKYLLKRVQQVVVEEKKKCIIFSQYHDTLRRLLDLFDHENYLFQQQKDIKTSLVSGDDESNEDQSKNSQTTHYDDVCPLSFCEYHIKMSPVERASSVTKFNTDPNVGIIIMQTDLAAYGINLTAASYIFIVDPIWDPSKERQAIKRAHRLGQLNSVIVEKLVISNSIEETILQLQSDVSLNKTDRKDKSEYDHQQLRKIHLLINSLNLLH